VSSRGIYTDLMRKFRDEGHEVYIVSPSERQFGQPTRLVEKDGISLLKILTLNIQKTNVIEKGLATLLIESQYLHGIRRFFPDVRFDLVLYSTPPITFTKVVESIKRRHGARSYLLLKDIFPQNAVDLGMMRHGGLFHTYFRAKEKMMYAVSDAIGCMSPANVKYVCEHNPEIDPSIVHVNPNSVEPVETGISKKDRRAVRDRHGIPEDATVFVYGGNLGRPQGINFILRVLESNIGLRNAFFLVVGSGTEFSKVKTWFDIRRPKNALLMASLPKNEYDLLVRACDVGMIFLDRRFTIPNFPSRLISYLECKMPVIAATDPNTDMGSIMEEHGFGLWSESGDLDAINRQIVKLAEDPMLRRTMGDKGYRYLTDNYTVDVSCDAVMKSYYG